MRFVSYEYAWPFGNKYRTYSMLLKILPFALYTSPLPVQALQSRSCFSYVSYATTAYSLEILLQLLTCPIYEYNISARITQKTPFLFCCATVALMSVGVPS
jgi:hypothetical protein